MQKLWRNHLPENANNDSYNSQGQIELPKFVSNLIFFKSCQIKHRVNPMLNCFCVEDNLGRGGFKLENGKLHSVFMKDVSIPFISKIKRFLYRLPYFLFFIIK